MMLSVILLFCANLEIQVINPVYFIMYIQLLFSSQSIHFNEAQDKNKHKGVFLRAQVRHAYAVILHSVRTDISLLDGFCVK